MNVEFIQWVATLGVGGVLAGMMFIVYRKDIKQYTDMWKTATEQLMIVVRENTATNTKLLTMMESLERRIEPRRSKSGTED